MLPLGFITMLITDDVGDKVIQILIALVAVIIVCFAWWTTGTTEQPHYRTVFLLDRRLRRRTNRTRLTTHIQTTSIVGGATVEGNSSTEVDNQTNQSAQTSETNKPPEASTSTDTSSESNNTRHIDTTTTNLEDEELTAIVQIMDADTNEVRLRRLAYYQNQQTGESSNENTNQASSSAEQSNENEISNPEESSSEPNNSNSTENVIDEHIDIINEPIMEHNYAERDVVHINPSNKDSSNVEESVSRDTTSEAENNDSSICIKLKYLNDELKLVDGRLEEQLGDFKRRHFHSEFSANKLVRLIFNGQVLQPDTETLQSCGLFDNCVVHCLIHQQRNTFSESNNSSGSGFTSNSGRTGGIGVTQNNNNTQGRDWDLGNVLLIFISIILGSAWYFRYEYAHLYTVTATVALVAITGIFTIFLVGVYFPDPGPSQPQTERQSVAT